MAQSRLFSRYAAAVAIAALAVAISPVGLRWASGRIDLSPRAFIVSVIWDVFLIFFLAALLAGDCARRVFFYLIAWTIPLAFLAALEGAAMALHLADRVASVQDLSLLKNRNHWPANPSAWTPSPEGFKLYAPWVGDGIVINEVGLRTASPTPKAAAEWRIAVTGGSAVWGWGILDADTIPARLQAALRRSGRANVSVYNFGIEGARITQELALLKHFQEIYGVDQVVFYTGGNDALMNYHAVNITPQDLWSALTNFELLMTIQRMNAAWAAPSPERLKQLDEEVLPKLARQRSLRDGIVAAADYCRAAALRCDFVLQPFVLGRRSPVGSEVSIVRALTHIHPRLDVLIAQFYRDALASAPAGHVHDMSDVFDGVSQQVFVDLLHLNEAGNELVARHLEPIVTRRIDGRKQIE